MKSANASSLRTHQAVARYGKAARHPLCVAALDLLRLEEEVFKWTEKIELTEELVNSVKQMKDDVQEGIEQFRGTKREKGKPRSALLRKIDKHLLKAQTHYQWAVEIRSFYQEMRSVALGLFKREYDRVIRTRDAKARRALQRLRKRWLANEAGLNAGNLRQVEMLKMLRDKVIEAKRAIDKINAGFWEALRGATGPYLMRNGKNV